jgi:predicted transcriptional regulator
MAKQRFPIGVYLSRSHKARIDAIADELGVARHSLMQWAVLDFIKRYDAGEVKPPVEAQMVLIPPEDVDS